MANTQEYSSDLIYAPCSFKFHDFSAKISDVTIRCEIMKMENSLYLSIGDSEKMEDLSVALTSDFNKETIATKIIGSHINDTSTQMAKRLSMKLGKPVYVSFNVTVNNLILPAIEKRIHQEFETHVDLLNFES